MASAARVARAAPNQIAPSAGSGTGSGGPGPVPGPGLGPVPAAIPAAVPQAAPALPAAEAIGSEFVAQYYAAMHARLDQLHRFYAEDSSLFVAGPGPAPSPVAATGLRAIDDALRRLAARRARVTVTSVDALHSAHGAVVVVVTGRAEGPGPGPVKNKHAIPSAIAAHRFTQTFVLAPQRGGFYVKNDLVRFLAEPHEPGLFPTNVPSLTPPTPPPNVANVANTNPNPETAAVSTAPAGESQSLEAIEAKLAAAARATNASRGSDGEEETREETTTKPGKEPKPTEEPPAGPPSYATALLKARAAAAAAEGNDGFAKLRKPPVAAAVSAASGSGSLGGPISKPAGPPSPGQASVGGLDKEVSTRVVSHAIFVRHFPPATTERDLRAVFESFGAVAEDGVTLRASKTQKSETTIEKHAFIEFIDKSGFDEALRFAATKEVLVLGAAVGVEAKREKPPARRDRGDGTPRNKSGADERGEKSAEARGRGAGEKERRAPRKNPGGARPGGREGEAGRREGGAGRARGRVDKR